MDFPKLSEVRDRPKRVRYCPSCGTKRLRAQVLHYECLYCLFQFFVTGADQIKNARHHREEGEMQVFECNVEVNVPSGRAGVGSLLPGIIPIDHSRISGLDIED